MPEDAPAPRVFSIYATPDRDAADRICACLEAAGVTCWIAARDLEPGTIFPGTMDDRRLATPAGSLEYHDLFYWISFATLTGLPATMAPVGRTAAGLPVGIQIMGPYVEHTTPIDIAGKLADVVGGFTPPPGYS